MQGSVFFFSILGEILIYFKGILMILSIVLLYFVTYAALLQIWYCTKLRICWGKRFFSEIMFVEEEENSKSATVNYV